MSGGTRPPLHCVHPGPDVQGVGHGARGTFEQKSGATGIYTHSPRIDPHAAGGMLTPSWVLGQQMLNPQPLSPIVISKVDEKNVPVILALAEIKECYCDDICSGLRQQDCCLKCWPPEPRATLRPR